MTRLVPLFLLTVACTDPQPGGVPDFALLDVNETSPTFNQELGPADFEGEVSAWYFGLATCPLCQSHVRSLDPLNAELAAMGLPVPVTVLGINRPGREEGNPTLTDGVDLPWLQDTAQANVFGTWEHEVLRELKIVGRTGEEVATFDLNVQDPGDEANYQAIKQALVDAAEDSPEGVPE